MESSEQDRVCKAGVMARPPEIFSTSNNANASRFTVHPKNTALQIYPMNVKIYENLSHLDVIGWVTMRKLSGNHLFSIDFPCVSFGFPAILLKAMWPTAAGLGSAELGTLGLAQVLKLYVF